MKDTRNLLIQIGFQYQEAAELSVVISELTAEMKKWIGNMEYIYLGDKYAKLGPWAWKKCRAVRRPDGKCIRGRNGNMLVSFECGTAVVVLARQLRKI